jgi:formylglycine-generating enzyme required for sulfatase activity
MKMIITLAASSIASFSMTAFAADQPAPAATAQTQTVPSDPAVKKPDSGPVKEVGFGAVRTPKLVNRVGGDRDAAIEVVEGVYRFKKAMIESPLPDGYPEPTPFGAIDIKEYPAVRRAELVSKDESGAAMMTGFFPLFNHIKKRNISMTAPVETDYPQLYTDFLNDKMAEEGETKMSFLYRSSSLGPVGEDGKIVVRDAAPVTVLSIGAQGAFDFTEKIAELRTWLKSQEQWEVAGDPRMFVYNGPFVDPNWRWAEVQVPVRRRGGTGKEVPTTQATKLPTSAPPKELVNTIGMKFIFIPKGQFAMGSAPGDRDADLDERQHSVTITRDFYIGAFEVTQSQFERVMGRNPSQFQGKSFRDGGFNHPVERVSWNDAAEFCKRLSELPEEKAAGCVYRLPTEAEWEYACRAGSSDAYAFGDQPQRLGEYCWYAPNGDGQTHPVGEKKPNAWGLYDMHGNAWEWCADWYERHSNRPQVDPVGPSEGTDRVYRGGSWNYAAAYCRSANRTATAPAFEGFDFLSISFRVVMDASTER